MMSSCSVSFLLALSAVFCYGVLPSVCCFYNMIHHAMPLPEGESPEAFGKPLYLTKSLVARVAETARFASAVYNLPNASLEVKSLSSYSGFLTVDENYNSSLFFWFFPAMREYRNAPLIIWLQGGPGFSSMIGVFAEHGPLVYNHIKKQVTLRESTWIKTFNMLYIDSPVGTGFSHTYSEKGYVRNQRQVTDHLITAINRFLTVFSEYRTNDIFLAGEGYACKTLFALADQIQNMAEGYKKLEVSGIIVGNGICNSDVLTNHTYILKAVGLIDDSEAKVLIERSQKIKYMIQMKRNDESFKELSQLFRDHPFGASLFRQMTGYESLYDYANPKIPEDLYIYTEYLAMLGVRRSLHVGAIPFGDHDKVCQYLVSDFGVSPNYRDVDNIFNNYKVLMYHGKRDILSSYGSFKFFIENINWNKADFRPRNFFWYRDTEKKGKQYTGHIRQIGDFVAATLHNAGHFASYDDPKTIEDIVNRFVFGTPFFNY